MNLLEGREGMPGLQATGRVACGQWKLQFLFQIPSPPAELPAPWRAGLYEFGLHFPSLVRNFTLNLHLQGKLLPDVNFFHWNPALSSKTAPLLPVKLCFPPKKGFVKNTSPNQMGSWGLSMTGASFPSSAPGDFHPAKQQPPGLFISPDLLITLQ